MNGVPCFQAAGGACVVVGTTPCAAGTMPTTAPASSSCEIPVSCL